MSRKKLIALFLLMSMIIGFSFLYINRVKSKNYKTASEKNIVAVKSEILKKGSIEKYQSFSGKTKGGEEEIISLKVPSTITEVKVKNGDYVKKGDVLLTLDSSEIDKQVESAKKAYEEVNKIALESNSKLNELNEKKEELYSEISSLEEKINSLKEENLDKEEEVKLLKESLENGEITKEEFDKKSKELISAINDNLKIIGDENKKIIQLKVTKEALDKTLGNIPQNTNNKQVESLKKAYDIALENKENYIVKSPINGYVEDITVRKGDSGITLMEPAMKIINKESINLELQIEEDDLDKFKVGQETQVEIHKEDSKNNFMGVIESIGSDPDKRTNQYSVVINIDNHEENINSNNYGKVFIPISKKENVLVVSKNSILREKNENFLFKLNDDNTVSRIKIETGAENDEFIEIIEGVSEGDEIVTKGKEFITDGDKISVVKEGE